MKFFEIEHDLAQNNVEDLWNKYISSSYSKNQSSIKYKNLSEFDKSFLKYIISQIDLTVRDQENKWVKINTHCRYKSKSKKNKITLYPLLSYLVNKRNENIKNFTKFSNISIINILYLSLKFTIYSLFFILLPLSLYDINSYQTSFLDLFR